MDDKKNEVTIKQTAARKKTASAKKKTAKKKTTKKKSSVSKKAVASHRKAAATSRKALTSKLKKEKLVRAAAKDEIAVLKDQLAAALKRERELSRISEQKIKKMLVAGERWEKVQLAKLKQAAANAKKKLKKK